MTAPSIVHTGGPGWGAIWNFRYPITLTWTYSDADGNPQSLAEISYRKAGTTAYTIINQAGAGLSYTFPANFFDGSIYVYRLRVQDSAGEWSNQATIMFDSSGWVYDGGTTATSRAISKDNINLLSQPAATRGEGTWEMAVRTLTGFLYSPLSPAQQFQAWNTDVFYQKSGLWQAMPRSVHTGGTMKRVNT